MVRPTRTYAGACSDLDVARSLHRLPALWFTSGGFGQSEAAKSLDVFRKEAVLGKQIKLYRLLTNEPSFPDAGGELP